MFKQPRRDFESREAGAPIRGTPGEVNIESGRLPIRRSLPRA